MHTCSNKIQKRIIEAMDNYLLDADNPTFLDLEEYIAEELGRDTFSFKEVSDNAPIITKLKDIFGEDIDLSSDESISHYSNILKDVKSYSIDDLFHGIPAAKVEFDSYVKRVVIGEGVLGKNNDDTYAVNDEQLNNNFTRIKSDLFNKIQDFLISKNLYHGDILPLYNEEEVANYDSYVNIMTIINDYFFNNPEIPIIKSYTNKKIPNLSVSDANKPILEAYYNMILLSNFDTVISTKFKNFFKVNLNKFNLLDSGFGENLKYYLKFDPITTPYWRNDNHQSDSSEERIDEFTRNIVSIIPLYNKYGVKTDEYLEVNDLYLIAAKVSEFELREGNRLKNQNTSFDYFNSNPIEKLKWYIENINKAISRESDSIQELNRYFDSIYDKILSIDKFINESEYNIAKKEANSGNSILGYIAQVINNNYGTSYASYDIKGKYNVQEMYNQDFNSTRVQSTVFSTLKMHYADKDFYNISDDFEELFPNRIDTVDNILHAVESGEIDYNKLNKYITSKTGIAMSKQSLINTIKDVSVHNKNGNPVNGIEFKSMLKELMLNLKADFNSDTFREAVALSNDKSVRLDSTVGKYLSNTVKNPLFIALKNSFIDKFTVKVVMNANTANGDTIPSFKIGNLTYKDTQLFDLRRQYERENPNGFFKSLLLKDSPAILGTLTKLEVVRKGRAKDYSKLTPEEQFISDFNYDFLKSLNYFGRFSVILGNYSDKPTILAKIINGDFKLTENGKPIVRESIDTILETVRVQSFSYYSDLLDSIFLDYKNIFDILGIKNNIDLNWKNNNKLEDNVKNINDILKVNSISSINDRLADISPDKRPNLLMQELHYSKYSNGTFLNNLILDNYLIFSDSSKDGLFYNMFVPKTESSFITKFSKFSNPDSLHIDKNEIDSYLNLLSINREDFKSKNGSKSTYEYDSLLINNKLNPFVKKWLWLNSLFRNEYLYIGVKGEYMHPHKSNILFRFGSNDKNYWDNYFLEMSKRMIPLGKRNVTYTAPIESPIRNSKRGVPDKINVAAIEDYKSNIYTTSGYKKIGADSHDGSSFLDYVYSKMVDESFPGKGYSGTKKQFATFVTPYGVTIKKDAESVITNAKILASGDSDINLLHIKYKMLNIPIGDDVRLTYNSGSLANYYIIRNGVRLRVNSIKINNDDSGNYISINYSKGIEKDGQIVYTGSIDTKEYIDTLYDIWNHIGAQYSIDVNGNFNEESNERLYDIVINTNNGILKTKMIHILSNVSALKAGAAGVNSASRWKSWDSLLYSTYNSRFMGPQLDASHEADQSEIREVSQVISALSQGGFTADIADEAYRDIANVIAKSMDKYLKHMKVDNVDKEALYNMLSAKFIRSIQKSDRDEVTKDLINILLDNGVPVPFSNQNFYNLYVREIITTLNNDFISRNYPGIGGVLIPSHGMIQLYDVLDGNKWITVTQEDIVKEALSVPRNNEKVPANSIKLYDTVVISGIELSVDTEQRLNWLKNTYGDRLVEKVPEWNNEDFVNEYIVNKLKDILVNSEDIELGDTIRIDGEAITLDTPAKYYSFKENGPSTVYRVLSKPRDLKPTLHTFKEIVYDPQANSEITIHKNTFDIQPLALLYKYTENILNDKDKIIINNIKNYIGNEDIVKFLRAWYQRDLQLLDHGLIMKELKETDNVSEYFKNDNVLDDILQDVLPYYQNNANKIVDLKFRPAEIMMPDIYKSTFNRDDNDSLYRIKKEGPKYFKNKFDILYDSDNTEADIKIVTSDVSNPVYIRLVTKLTGVNNVNIKRNPDVDYELYSRYNEVGDRLYDLVDYKNIRAFSEGGKEIIEIKVGYTDKNGKNILKRNAFANVERLIKSFTDIRAIVPLNNGNISSAYYSNIVSKEEMLDISEQEIKNVKNDDSLDPVNVYSNISNIFSKYNGINLVGIDTSNKNWFFNNKELILNRLANSIYASWEKSHDVVASRIPSQSMQSFMPMRNVGYIKGNTNDVYVSVHQIFLQGSDFDVDKAYILGHGFLNNGRTDLWTNLSSYSTVDQSNALMQLPMPNGKTINIIEGNGNPNLEILYNQIANSLANVSYEYELPTETILLFNKFIRALPTTNLDVLPINISQENPNLSFNEFERLLNKHTTYTDYSTSPYSVKNSIVQKINKVISSASNQINANTPVDVQPLHDAIRNVQNKRNGQTQPKNVSSSNNINSSNNNEIGNPNIVFRTSSSSNYKDRTYENASADATIALATDFNSRGELATKAAVLGQNKKYIPIDANNLNVTPERVDKIVNELNNTPVSSQFNPTNATEESRTKYASMVEEKYGKIISSNIEYTDINMQGEQKPTYKIVLEKGTFLINFDIGSIQSLNSPPLKSPEDIRTLIGIGKLMDDKAGISLNIAGNGIYTMKGKYTQDQVDEFTYKLLKAIIESPNLKLKINSIRSGGQTGFDEAGAKAGIKLGIPVTVLAPKGWKFRDINGKDISDEKKFKERFNNVLNKNKQISNPILSKEQKETVKTPTIQHIADHDSDLGKDKKGYEQFRIYERIDNQDGYSLAYGKPIKIKGFEEFDFYLAENQEGRPWTTYEKRTGRITSRGNTQKEAIESLQTGLNSAGLDNMRNIISSQRSVYEENQVEENTNNIKEGVIDVFNDNPELANAVYKTLGFGQLKEPKVNDIVTLEFYFEKEDKIVPVKVKITELEKFYQGASTIKDNQGNIIKQEKGTLEYFLTLEKLDGGKKYEVSVGEDGYINQFVGGTGKIRVGTNNYIPEFDLSKSQPTPQQKQEAQTKFQEYVDATGRQDIEGFREFVNSKPDNTSSDDNYTDDSDYNEDNLNSHDMISYYQQQYDASVGKDNTGIAANGVKGLFALTAYYNNFFLNTWGNKDLTDTELRRSSKLFKKDIKFKDDFGNDVRIFIGSLPDVLINRKQEESLKRVLGDNYSRLFPNSAVYMSAFVSAATDNAKELIMAKVNASPKLAGMHAYMIALGFTPDQITEFMTSKTASKIVLRSTDNIYDNELSNSVTKVIRELKSDSTVDQSQLSAFEQLYLDSQEFANLTSILGVNQKLKARTWEMYNFLSRFDNILSSAEKLAIKSFKDLDKIKFRNAILKYNKLLTPEDSNYIDEIYDAINSLTLENGKTVKILHNFNSNYYFSSPRYRHYVKEYYNLIKRTFNIFEVVDEVPHFKKLIESLSMSDNVLKNTTEKYNYTLNTLKNVLNDESHELNENDIPLYVNINNLTKGSNYFDTKAILLWLKTDKMSKYAFDVGKILRQAGMDSITLYKDSSSRYNLETITVTPGDDYIVDLTTDYGIANFKKLMEEAVLPLLQQLDNSNVIKNLRVETITNQYGLKTNAIVSAYELKRLNSSIAIEQFNQLIDAFNNIDINTSTANKFQNAYGEPIQWRDLFYIYNLVVNNERYGNKRLTPLFRDYIRSFNSLSLDYMKFFSKIDKGDIDVLYADLYNNPEYINADEDTRKVLKEKYDKTINEDLLFYSFSERGVLSGFDDDSEVRTQIANPDFVLTWNITGKYDTSYYKMNSLLRKINLGGFIVEFNC